MSDVCPICSSQLKEFRPNPGGRDASFFSCPLCGDFVLSGSLIATLPHTLKTQKDAAAKISHALREMQYVNKGAEFYTSTVDAVLKQPLPRPREQADLLIRWLAENVDGPGEKVWVEAGTHSAIIGAKSPEGFNLVLDHLFEAGLVTGDPPWSTMSPGSVSAYEDPRAHVTLSFKGWDYSGTTTSGWSDIPKSLYGHEIRRSKPRQCVRKSL